MKCIITLFTLIATSLISAQITNSTPQYSTAGFYEIPETGREVYNFNAGWRFYKGDVNEARKAAFDDAQWEMVNCPHGLELISTMASGSNNYQGVAWYRKHFTVPENIEDKKLSLYFEAIMGKSKIYLNGELIKSNFGGYLPFSVDLSKKIKKGEENVIAVWTDNSDDPDYPPGKPQEVLDFSYFGGIYRDVFLIATNHVFITDPNEADKIAGGGLFVHFEDLSKEKVNVVVTADILNQSSKSGNFKIQYLLKDTEGNIVAKRSTSKNISKGNSEQFVSKILVKKPHLWSPDMPYLYNLECRLLDKKGKVVDGFKERIGVRKIEFRGKDGFYLNNELYPRKLMGANRHQDHAYVGNALPNSGQWKDAKILKKGGCDIVRAAHYPADPAFMDACDELGLFFIVATPGWQFWNDKPIFKERVYSDIRAMVRRDRNHPSVLMWEPILNETWYPEDFAKTVHNIVHEEYPYQGCYTVADRGAKGQEYFDVIYSHPLENKFYKEHLKDRNEVRLSYENLDRCVFTREWGDSVDDWNSHNSPSRVSRGWGESAQLVQSKHYSNPDYVFTSWEVLHDSPNQQVGGALWHSFDHQRGYHPDPFYGGLTDSFRQPKYSYAMFTSQRDVSNGEPFISIAHEMTPFSGSDVTVFTNCDEVRLIVFEKDTILQDANPDKLKMPHPPVVFKDVFNFMDLKQINRQNKKEKGSLIAQGLVNGKIVVETKKMPSLRKSKIMLELLDSECKLVADGSDFVTIIASITDDNGNVKRLNDDVIQFEVEGEGEIIGDHEIQANPRPIEWGTAPVLIRSTMNSGKITVRAKVIDEGVHTPVSGAITFNSTTSTDKFIYDEKRDDAYSIPRYTDSIKEASNPENIELQKEIQKLKRELNQLKLKTIEKQQEDFEGGK